MTQFVEEGRTVDVIYSDFSQALDTISHIILLFKLRCYSLHRTTGCIEKNGWTIRLKGYWLMVCTLSSHWLQVEFLREPILGHVLLSIFINDLEEDTESFWVKLE